MLRVQLAVVETAGLPLTSLALFWLMHERWWTPTPPTGTWTLAAAYHWLGPPSSEHEIPATPLGPAPAVAAMYWVPALDGASVGPESDIVGCSLSTLIVFEYKMGTPAASDAPITSGIGPLPYCAVSTCSLTAGAEHWCQTVESLPELEPGRLCRLSEAVR